MAMSDGNNKPLSKSEVGEYQKSIMKLGHKFNSQCLLNRSVLA